MRARRPEHESGELVCSGGALRYAWKAEQIWSFPLRDLRLIAEHTNEDGPWRDDWFYVFATQPDRWYEAPVYAASEDLRELLTRELGVSWSLSLVGSTTFASHVLWPPELAGRPLYTYASKRRGRAPWNRVKDWFVPLVQSELTDEVRAYVEASSR